MADEKPSTSKLTRDRINVTQEREVQHWANRFGVTAAEVEAAVKAVGSLADDVRRYLNKG